LKNKGFSYRKVQRLKRVYDRVLRRTSCPWAKNIIESPQRSYRDAAAGFYVCVAYTYMLRLLQNWDTSHAELNSKTNLDLSMMISYIEERNVAD